MPLQRHFAEHNRFRCSFSLTKLKNRTARRTVGRINIPRMTLNDFEEFCCIKLRGQPVLTLISSVNCGLDYAAARVKGALTAGLREVPRTILTRLPILICQARFPDSKWGYCLDSVHAVCEQSKHASCTSLSLPGLAFLVTTGQRTQRGFRQARSWLT